VHRSECSFSTIEPGSASRNRPRCPSHCSDYDSAMRYECGGTSCVWCGDVESQTVRLQVRYPPGRRRGELFFPAPLLVNPCAYRCGRSKRKGGEQGAACDCDVPLGSGPIPSIPCSALPPPSARQTEVLIGAKSRRSVLNGVWSNNSSTDMYSKCLTSTSAAREGKTEAS
jgi:hypothetical protein